MLLGLDYVDNHCCFFPATCFGKHVSSVCLLVLMCSCSITLGLCVSITCGLMLNWLQVF